MTQVDDADFRYWSYREWRSGRVYDVSDSEVRSTVLELIERQRGDSVNMRAVYRALLSQGVRPHPDALRVLLVSLGLVKISESTTSLAESYLIPQRFNNP